LTDFLNTAAGCRGYTLRPHIHSISFFDLINDTVAGEKSALAVRLADSFSDLFSEGENVTCGNASDKK